MADTPSRFSQRATAERSALLSSSTAFASSSSATSRLQTRHPSTSSPYNHQSDPGSPFSINMSQTPSGSGSAAPRYTLNNPNGIGNDFGASMHNNARTRAALGEHDFMQSTGSTLDGYIALGQATMMNLGNQRDMLKGQSLTRLGTNDLVPVAPRVGQNTNRGDGVVVLITSGVLSQALNDDSFRLPTRSGCRGTRYSTSKGGPKPTSTSYL